VVYDLCLTCEGTGRAARSNWTNTSLISVRVHQGPQLLYHSHASHGFSIHSIKEWRAREHATGRPNSLIDFYVTHGICYDCSGDGVRMVGREALSPEEKAELPWLDPDEDHPIFDLCPKCQGSGKAAIH